MAPNTEMRSARMPTGPVTLICRLGTFAAESRIDCVMAPRASSPSIFSWALSALSGTEMRIALPSCEGIGTTGAGSR